MATRPSYIDLRSQSHGPIGTGLSSPALPSPRSLPSPRLHVAGEVPPELSPLDAFAAQSRLLAKQLDETTSSGRRLSRLPPLMIENTFLQNRPGYFRSASSEDAAHTPSPKSPGGLKTEVENPASRPVSIYPEVSGSPPPLPPVPPPRFDAHDEEQFRGRPTSTTTGPIYFGARREQSPMALDRENRSPRTGHSPSGLQPRPSVDSIRQRRGQTPLRSQDAASLATGGYDSRALAPPRSPFPQRAPSPRSMSESSDDDLASRVQTLSPRRKLSGSSGMSVSPTRFSPGLHSIARSPSISSEISVGGTRLPRPTFNFSRPLSRVSTSGPPVEIPSRQASSDSQPSFVLADDTANTPVSMHSESFPDTNSETGNAAPSYVYSTYSLPRGKTLQRNSLIFQENLPQAQFSWEQPVPFSNVHPLPGGAPPSPPSRPSTSSRAESSHPSLDTNRPSFDPGQASPEPARLSYEIGRESTEHQRKSMYQPSKERPTSASAASSSTIKAPSQHAFVSPAECSAEEHVSKAIEYHEAGALTKSTYHLRLAARQNHPTGMLLYALACRHGWGMRPNQREGVEWLRRAVDVVSLEMADDQDILRDGKVVDPLELKTRKAQFALSIYELGVSHMNGWGIEQDKALALRCFEIAGCELTHNNIWMSADEFSLGRRRCPSGGRLLLRARNRM
jgi:hypothetical protein